MVFGYGARPWSEVGLPIGYYWTGTASSGNLDYSWIVSDYGGKVGVGGIPKSFDNFDNRLVCVP